MTRDYYVLTGETLRLVSRTDSSLAEIEIDARSPLSAASDGRYVYAVFSESSDRRKIISYDTLTGSIQNLADRFGVGGLAVDGRGLWMTNRAMNKIIADSIQYACTTVIDGCDVFPLDPEEWFDTDKDGNIVITDSYDANIGKGQAEQSGRLKRFATNLLPGEGNVPMNIASGIAGLFGSGEGKGAPVEINLGPLKDIEKFYRPKKKEDKEIEKMLASID